MNPMGGTEIVFDRLKNTIGIPESINIFKSFCSPEQILENKSNILWQHHNFDQPDAREVSNNGSLNKIDSIVYVSNWQSEKWINILGVKDDNSIVIKNSINKIDFKERSRDKKIKLVYHTTPWRGLDILLDAFEILNRDDVELDIYSSTMVYGSEYDKYNYKIYKPLFDRAKKMKNVNYIGYVSNKEIINVLQEANIFSYPSTWMETSCISMIEAGAAGCNIVSTNLGALPETAIGFGNLIHFTNNKIILTKRYVEALNYEIDNYWSTENQNKIRYQSEAFNYHYSWDKIQKDWIKLFDKLIRRKKWLEI